METKRVQLDLSEQEHAEMERLMAHAGLKTKREFVSNALSLFKWAANELANGRRIASLDPDGQSVVHFTMPCLEAFSRLAEELDRRSPSAEELRARSRRGGIPASQVMAEMRKLLESAADESRPDVFVGSEKPASQTV